MPKATRVCDQDDCDRKHVARGLCSMHWRRAHGKRTKYARTCDACASEYLSDRPNGRFCSDACKGEAYRIEKRKHSRAVVGPIEPDRCELPDRHPARRVESAPRTWFAGGCAWCGEMFVDNQPAARYCSRHCCDLMGARNSRRRKGWPKLYLTPLQRCALYERDAWVCQLCAEPVDPLLTTTNPNDDWAASLDHIVPRTHGGTDDDGNLRLAHRWCNSVRSDESYYTAGDLAAPAA